MLRLGLLAGGVTCKLLVWGMLGVAALVCELSWLPLTTTACHPVMRSLFTKVYQAQASNIVQGEQPSGKQQVWQTGAE